MKHEGSDLHLKVGLPPMMRLKGVIRQMEMPPLTQEDMERLLFPIMTERQQEDPRGDGRRRLRPHHRRRRVPLPRQPVQAARPAQPGRPPRQQQRSPPSRSWACRPVIEKLCHYDQGMIILAGVTGAGKSTTIASMLDYINERERVHILTIEDPIEFTFTDKKSVINQREVGIDVMRLAHGPEARRPRRTPTSSWWARCATATPSRPASTRPRPATWSSAPSTPRSAASTIGRILDLFPADMHPAIRQALAFNLKAVVARSCCPASSPACSGCRPTRS